MFKIQKRFTFIELFSLVVRLALWGWVVVTRHWVAGDSLGFMGHGVQFCSGDFFSGESTKSPLYTLLTCAFSLPAWPMAGPLDWMSRAFGGVLLAQSLFLWGSGVWVRRRFQLEHTRAGKVWQVVYHADPLMFIYSGLLMSDAFFAAFVLICTVFALRWFSEKREADWKDSIWLGLWCGLAMLERSVGMIWVAWLLLCLFVFVLVYPIFWKRFMLWVGVAFLVISPRLFYEWHWHQRLALNEQGGTWFESVAAAVEGDSRGLSFKQAEDEWNAKQKKTKPLDVLLEHPWVFSKLSMKGMARTILGHVNVEWGLVATGKTIFGPAWFKKQERFTGDPGEALYVGERGISKALWSFGVAVGLFWILGVYFLFALDFAVVKESLKKWGMLWLFGTVVLMCVLPLIFGDARFRLGFLPALLVAWAFGIKSSTRKLK